MEAGPGPRRHLLMGDAGGPSESSGGDGSGKDLPVMPGPEKPLLHIAIEFVEMLDNALAEHQMLNVAHGELPAALSTAGWRLPRRHARAPRARRTRFRDASCMRTCSPFRLGRSFEK